MLPLVVQIEKTEQHTADTTAFNRSPVRIGRNALNDLQLEEAFVSDWHAVVRFNDSRTTVLDLGSTNRTTVNGVAIERNVEVPVDYTSDVRIGTLRLHFLRVQAPPELIGRRRNSAFARVGNPAQGEMRTMFLGDRTPGSGTPQKVGGQPLPDGFAPTAHAQVANQPVSVRAGVPDSGVQPASSPPSSQRAPSSSVRPVGSAAAAAQPAAPARMGLLLDDGFRAYRAGWTNFFSAVRARLESIPSGEREREVLELQQRFPQLALEPEFRTYLSQLGIDPLKAGTPEMEGWLRRLTADKFPPPGSSINIAIAMERVGELLEVFAQAFIELRRAHEQFCREMSLTRYADQTPLQTQTDKQAILAYLLSPSQEGGERPNELSRALADLALHQVALVSSVVEGARSMLEGMSPSALRSTADPPPTTPVLNGESFIDSVWPVKARKLWRRFAVLHHDLAEGDRFTRELFGRAFARRYYSVTSGDSGGSD
jgi:predicted component of type VI protein secretion system